MPNKPEIGADPPDLVDVRALIERADFPHLLNALHSRGYRVVGPTLRDQAIVYDELDSEADLPIGWTDEQDAWPLSRLQSAQTRRSLATTSGRTPGNAICIRRSCASGKGANRRTAFRSRRSRKMLLAMPFLACARASFTPSRSRTVCSLAALYRPRLWPTSEQRLHCGRQLRRGWRNLLLHLDGYGSTGRYGL